jgi:hypothetical protein
MWTLIVLMAGFNPPTGIIKYGFETENDCWEEAASYCDGSKQFRCSCTNKLPLPKPGFTR